MYLALKCKPNNGCKIQNLANLAWGSCYNCSSCVCVCVLVLRLWGGVMLIMH